MAKIFLPALMKARPALQGLLREGIGAAKGVYWEQSCLPFRDVQGSLRSAQSELPKKTGGLTTGRCNTGLKFTCGRFKAQSFPRALIETQSYFVNIGENGYVGMTTGG
jgi:hypothetical protein